MTKPTKEQRIAARDGIQKLSSHDVWHKADNLEEQIFWWFKEHAKTILPLLDNAINAPDLSELKRECIKLYSTQYRYDHDCDLINDMLDGLAPRIIRAGMVVVPEEPTEGMCLAGSGFSPNAIRDNDESEKWYQAGLSVARDTYKSMIAAAKGD